MIPTIEAMKILKNLSKFYTILSKTQRKFFSTLDFLVHKPDAKVVSVGNLSIGGTGKTPVLIELLNELGTKSCVLTRGYRCPWERSFYHLEGLGPHPSLITDEALMVNARFPNISIYIGKNRHHTAKMASHMGAPQIYLLDDGFQYRRLRKDYNIVLFDAMCTEKEAQVMPLGRFREPLSRLTEAHCILLTRCNTASQSQVDHWLETITKAAPKVPIVQVGTYCDGIFNFLGNRLPDASGPYLAFSAIGRPESFYAQLETAGCKVEVKEEFRDHHRFTIEELESLLETAQSKGLSLICTEKDAIKISPVMALKMDLQILRIRVQPTDKSRFIDRMPGFKELLEEG